MNTAVTRVTARIRRARRSPRLSRPGAAVVTCVLVAALTIAPPRPGPLRAQEAAATHYHVVKRIPIGGPDGFWDYLTVDTAGHRLFISHGTHVQVLDLATDSVTGDIPGTEGVHGIALAPELGRGYTSDGRDSTVTVVDLKSLKPITKIQATGRNPDAILYDPFSRRVFTFNHSRGNVTAIDAPGDSVLATIPVGGTLEFAVSDRAGHLFDNVEDSSQLVEIDARALTVVAKWPLSPCEEPTGLSIDRVHHRLFVGCGNGRMAVVDALSGKVLTTLPVGNGVDATRFDPGTGLAFASAGEGNITVVREIDPDHFAVVQTVPTERGARTMGLDERTHRLYTVTMKFRPAPASAGARERRRGTPVPGSFEVLVISP